MEKVKITLSINQRLLANLKAIAKDKQCSISYICEKALKQYFTALELPISEETLRKLSCITRLSLATITRYYKISETSKTFWELVLPSKSGATIMEDLKGHFYAKFKKREDYIPLPETGDLPKDIEEGVKNFQKAPRIIHEIIPIYTQTKNKKSSLRSQIKNKKENN